MIDKKGMEQKSAGENRWGDGRAGWNQRESRKEERKTGKERGALSSAGEETIVPRCSHTITLTLINSTFSQPCRLPTCSSTVAKNSARITRWQDKKNVLKSGRYIVACCRLQLSSGSSLSVSSLLQYLNIPDGCPAGSVTRSPRFMNVTSVSSRIVDNCFAIVRWRIKQSFLLFRGFSGLTRGCPFRSALGEGLIGVAPSNRQLDASVVKGIARTIHGKPCTIRELPVAI